MAFDVASQKKLATTWPASWMATRCRSASDGVGLSSSVLIEQQFKLYNVLLW